MNGPPEYGVWWALSALAGLFGGYLGAYMAQKGENKAIHEDIEKLVDQVKAVTQATKEIEAQISSDLWNRQRKLEVKKEALFRSTKDLSALHDSLSSLSSAYKAAHESGAPNTPEWLVMKKQALESYHKASVTFSESQLVSELVCDLEVRRTMTQIGWLLQTIADDIASNNNFARFTNSLAEIRKDMEAARVAMRKELGIDA